MLSSGQKSFEILYGDVLPIISKSLCAIYSDVLFVHNDDAKEIIEKYTNHLKKAINYYIDEQTEIYFKIRNSP